MLVKAYRQFEERVGVTTARRGAKRDMIRDKVSRLPNRFRYADLERALPAVSRPTIARALRELALKARSLSEARPRRRVGKGLGSSRPAAERSKAYRARSFVRSR